MKETYTRDDRKQFEPVVAAAREFVTSSRHSIAIVASRRETSSKLESGVHGEPVLGVSW